MSIGLARDQWNQRLTRDNETDKADILLEIDEGKRFARDWTNVSLKTDEIILRLGAIDHSLNHVCLDVIINNKMIQTIWEGKTLDSMHDAQSKNMSILQRETNHIFIIIMNKDANLSKKKMLSLKDH